MFFKQYKTGLNQIDQQLLQYLDYSGGFFVELGANDGIRQSNTLFLEKKKHWKGLLIEPFPERAKECEKNRPNSLYSAQHVFRSAITKKQLNCYMQI